MPSFAKYRSPVAMLLWFLAGLILTVQLYDWLVLSKRQQAALNEGVAGYDFPTLSLDQFEQARTEIRGEKMPPGEVLGVSPEHASDQSTNQKAAPQRHSENTSRWEKAKRLNQIVHQTLRHDDTVRIRPGENWIQWLAGIVYPPLQWPQLPDQIVGRQAGICSDACLALQSLLLENQIPNRFVGLSGHVVLEVQIADQWRLLDPDFGVDSDASVRELSQAAIDGQKSWQVFEQMLKSRAYSMEQIENYREILASTEDNLASPTNQPLNPRLYQFAWVTGWLSRLSSLILFVVGAGLIGANRRDASHKSRQQNSTSESNA